MSGSHRCPQCGVSAVLAPVPGKWPPVACPALLITCLTCGRVEDVVPLPPAWLTPLVVEPLPREIQPGPKKKQGTRLIKLMAASCCGYVVRTTRKWLDEQGLPVCPHGNRMHLTRTNGPG